MSRLSETGEVTIRLAERADAARLNAALRKLSERMGDVHRAGDAELQQAGFGPAPVFRALLAEGRGEIVGAVVVSPFYSTSYGAAGAYVSDLWVSPSVRGQGLGVRLLTAVRDMAARDWGAGLLRLAVYDDNPRARAFYDRLGFEPAAGETWMNIRGAALAKLGGAA